MRPHLEHVVLTGTVKTASEDCIMEGSTRKSVLWPAAGMFSAVTVLAFGLFSSSPAAADVDACVATLTPDSVMAGAPSANLSYSLSETIGTVKSVVPPEDSGLKVSTFDADASTLTLDATNAKAGTYTLQFTGDPEKTCAGDVRVTGM
jgi:hypothetical protein